MKVKRSFLIRDSEYYMVEGHTGWFVCWTYTMRQARKIGVQEYGRGGVVGVRVATMDEARHYRKVHGGLEWPEDP